METQTGPTLSSAEITFSTTADDKDWDTKPYADINLDGRNIASLDCCSSDRNDDHWSNGRTVTKPLNIHENPSKSDINSRGTCTLGSQAGPHGGGNDTWKFNASLTIHYSDGTSSYFSGSGWNGIELYSHSQSRESANPIPLHI